MHRGGGRNLEKSPGKNNHLMNMDDKLFANDEKGTGDWYKQ